MWLTPTRESLHDRLLYPSTRTGTVSVSSACPVSGVPDDPTVDIPVALVHQVSNNNYSSLWRGILYGSGNRHTDHCHRFSSFSFSFTLSLSFSLLLLALC